MTGSPIFSINFKNRKNPANPNYHIVSTSRTSRLWDFYNMFLLGAGLLMFVTIFMIFSFSRWEIFNRFSLLMHVQFMINLQNRLVWSGSRHMIVWSSWIFSICEVYWKYRTTGHLVFGIDRQSTWKKFKVSQNMVSFSEPSVNQTLHLRSIKHFRIP